MKARIVREEDEEEKMVMVEGCGLIADGRGESGVVFVAPQNAESNGFMGPLAYATINSLSLSLYIFLSVQL